MSRSGLLAATVTALVVVLVGVWLRTPDPWEMPDAEPPAETGEDEGEATERPPARSDSPLEEPAGRVWSDVPHELVVARDDGPDERAEGPRRLLVAVVEPDLPDADVERLVRDIRAHHRDAEVLRIRVFDSREAAVRPSPIDGGAAGERHLVAELLREPGRERLRVRGLERRP